MTRENLSKENQQYNDQAILLDGLYEFHPEYFTQLAPDELKILKTYYLVGEEPPEDIFGYRKELLAKNPDIVSKAETVFSKLRAIANIPKP